MFLFLQYVYYKNLIKPKFLGLKMSAVYKGAPFVSTATTKTRVPNLT